MNTLILTLLLVQGTGAIDGTVVRSGSSDPLPQTQIVIARVGAALRDSRIAATDANGKFSISGLSDGSYRLFFEREGFVRGEYGQRSPGKPGIPIDIAAGKNVSGIVQPLTAEGTILGRVVNASGEPVANVTVRVLSAAYRDGVRSLQPVQSAQTNDLGDYRLFGLTPGKYFLSATPPPSPTIQDGRINTPSGNGIAMSPLQNLLATGTFIDPRALDGGTDLTVYFPGTTDAAAATAIELQPGLTLRAPELRMVRARSFLIRGEIVDETGKPASAEISTLTRVDSPASAGIRGPNLGTSTTFEFSGLLPGVYELNAADNGTNAQKTGHMTITVGNENIENLRLVLQPVFQVKGRTVQEDPAADPSTVRVQLRGSRGFASLQTTPTAADGTFTLTRVAPDTYRLAFVGLTGNVFVRSARFGGADVLNSTLRIDREPADQLEVVLSQKTGSLDVFVTGRDQKPSPATTVVLIPEPALRDRFELYRNATTDSAGRVHLSSVAPGTYKLFAWPDIEPNAWQNSDVIRQYEDRGIPVSIGDSEKAAATVRAIE